MCTDCFSRYSADTGLAPVSRRSNAKTAGVSPARLASARTIAAACPSPKPTTQTLWASSFATAGAPTAHRSRLVVVTSTDRQRASDND